jgi:hypothetical protein
VAEYITIADINDNVIKGVANLQTYIDATNRELERKAMSFGVAVADIIDPITSTVYNWAVNYCCMIVAKDKACTNNNDISQDDKYLTKLKEIYRPDNNEFEKQLNAEQFKGELADKRVFSSTGKLGIG